MPRFQYEEHIRTLVEDRLWPQSTRAISELRLTIEYESASGWSRMFSAGRLTLDIVDYPGEWLLDLPLLDKDYATSRREAIERARLPVARRDGRARTSRCSRPPISTRPPTSRPRRRSPRAFTDYLQACRADARALSTLPPGRFLMPGDLEGSPALTFAPLPGRARPRPIRRPRSPAMMARRYEAYKTVVVKPFFREHFARLDRQIVLVDVLQAINAGPEAVPTSKRRWPTSSPASGRAARPGSAPFSAGASTASCSPRPRPTISTARATAGWRRS